ncbi:Aste57867_12903 [Aphanomyces stellatus]|uniref:Aste57867_12903 protein n=1 Tax=Aphanomyces stellatus TaxID=120398 RepID=A0A485KWU2_9STRA|nr:hypothetical protein As57867_012855 [Aphanomyces stellatus]VFT89750.1 Aste57867_12903 [Aphanomyces stellatus]
MTPSTSSVTEIPKSGPTKLKNCPDDSRFTQQTLPVWKPILTLRWSVGVLFVAAIVCLALGVAVVQRSNNMSVYRVYYDGPSGSAAVSASQPGGAVAYLSKCHVAAPGEANSFSGTKTCFITITLTKDISGDALVFYELTPFNQNHRRYMTSQLVSQFQGWWKPTESTSACDPVIQSVDAPLCNATVCFGANKSRQQYPCGLVANTMFNDIFWLHNGTLPSGRVLGHGDLTLSGVARVYQSYNYANPASPLDLDAFLPIWHNPNYSRIIPPPGSNLPSQINADYSNSTAWSTTPPGTGVEHEGFRVWTSLAASENLRKPYGRISVSNLPAGTQLTFAVQSNFYAEGATKAIVVAELAWFGSENIAMGIVFLVAGSLCFLSTVVFFVKAVRNPRRLGDVTALKWKLH